MENKHKNGNLNVGDIAKIRIEHVEHLVGKYVGERDYAYCIVVGRTPNSKLGLLQVIVQDYKKVLWIHEGWVEPV